MGRNFVKLLLRIKVDYRQIQRHHSRDNIKKMYRFLVAPHSDYNLDNNLGYDNIETDVTMMVQIGDIVARIVSTDSNASFYHVNGF